MSVFSESHLLALRSVKRIWPGKEIVVVGGLAVAHHTQMGWRTTKDLDLAVGIAIEEFPGDLARAEDWQEDPDGRDHRKVFRGPQGDRELLVDFLPVDPAARRRDRITWSSSQHSMSIVGFDLAYQHSTKVEVANAEHVAIVDLPMLVLLKMNAYVDRPMDRKRDLQDVLEILRGHVDRAGERMFEDRFAATELSPEEVAAYLIGEEVEAVADQPCRERISQFLALVNDGELDLLAVTTGVGREQTNRLWRAMKSGLDKAL